MDASIDAQPATIDAKGRPMMKKTERVLELLKNKPALSVAKIAEIAQTTKQYVYDVRYRYITRPTKPQRKLRKTKSAGSAVKTSVVPVSPPFTMHFAEFDSMRREIADLKAVIRYLEEKISHGASV